MTTDADVPMISLTPEMIACSRHGEPFRTVWPRGWGSFGRDLFDEADIEVPDSEASAAALVEALNQKPLCERVSKATLIRLYIESGIGRDGVCQICKQTEPGSRYVTRDADGTLRRWRHIGFRCVVDMGLVN
jgi:hypothetical protein